MTATVAQAYRYAEQVSSGEITACKWVKLAVKRFYRDIEQAEKRGIYFDEEEANFVLEFFNFTRHVKGALAGKPIALEDWQVFIIANLFGWRRVEDGLRRFRTSYTEVARKNGKSALGSCIGLYMCGFDGESGAEVYSAATTRDQAKIVFADAWEMARKSPVLKKRFKTFKHNIHVENNASKFEALSADANTLDGLNIHCGLIDELHAHKTREVWDVLETGTGAREQPLICAITTAGSNREGICYEQRDYLTRILEGLEDDDSYFGIIYTLDEDDNWQDESTWIKANPNLGVSKKWDDMRRLAKKAAAMPTAKNNFLTKHLNVWVNAASAWLDVEAWLKCRDIDDDERLKTYPCYIGMDLANKKDIAALIAIFRDPAARWHVRGRFYLPEEAISIKRRSLGNLYSTWAEQGYLVLTPGNVIDHERIEDDLREWLVEFDVQEVGFDPWGSVQLATRMMAEGAPMVQVQQSTKNFSEAMKEVEALMLSDRLHHDHNPVLNWMASNVSVKPDKNENIFPLKEHEDKKIDGMVALFMAMNRGLLFDDTSDVGIRLL